jgi:hypothetical protein
MSSSSGEVLLVDAAPARYAPTAGLAVGDNAPVRPVRATAIALPAATPSTMPVIEATWDRLSAAVEHPVRISGPLNVDSPLIGKLFDQLLVLLETDIVGDASTWSPLPIDRGDNAGTLARWIALPYEGPERVLLTGVRIAMDVGQRSRRRGTANRVTTSRDGDDLFQAACGMHSSGVRTLLISRWQTGGAVQESLVREFAGEMNRVSAAEAWQRSVRLARAMPLDPAQEPRFRANGDAVDMPTADHPFFWAGFVLFDSGRDPNAKEEPLEEPRVVEASKPRAPEAGKPAAPAPPADETQPDADAPVVNPPSVAPLTESDGPSNDQP